LPSILTIQTNWNTTIWLSAFRTSTVVLSGGATNSVIDNPIVNLTTSNVAGLPTYAVYGGLTSIGTQNFRTAGKQ
jgi:hypothetical protein